MNSSVEAMLAESEVQLANIKGGADTLAQFRLQFEDTIEGIKIQHGEISLYIKREAILPVCKFLRDEPKLQFNFLSDLCGVDKGIDEDPRFEVIYHLFSIPNLIRLRLKVRIPENDCAISTVSGIWQTANWHERETYDLLGINFINHPDLRKILTPEDLEGYPLRKDFPLRGY